MFGLFKKPKSPREDSISGTSASQLMCSPFLNPVDTTDQVIKRTDECIKRVNDLTVKFETLAKKINALETKTDTTVKDKKKFSKLGKVVVLLQCEEDGTVINRLGRFKSLAAIDRRLGMPISSANYRYKKQLLFKQGEGYFKIVDEGSIVKVPPRQLTIGA